MGFQLSPIIQPQFVSNAAAALTLTVDAAGATGVAVLPLTKISLWTCRFANVSGSPVTLKVWRVPSGATDDDQHVVVRSVVIPVATESNPYFAWDPQLVLSDGDAIWALASAASAVSVSGDGGISV